jgi:RHS repeat-associated protein
MDHRGTVYAVTDPSQGAMLKYFQDAFGVNTGIVSGALPQVTNDYVYQSDWHTSNIGKQVYLLSKYRIYLPLIGRFTQRDPYSVLPLTYFRQLSHTYEYCGNDVIGNIDRFGLQEEDLHEIQHAISKGLKRIDKIAEDISQSKDRYEEEGWKVNELTNTIKTLERQIKSIESRGSSPDQPTDVVFLEDLRRELIKSKDNLELANADLFLRWKDIKNSNDKLAAAQRGVDILLDKKNRIIQTLSRQQRAAVKATGDSAYVLCMTECIARHEALFNIFENYGEYVIENLLENVGKLLRKFPVLLPASVLKSFYECKCECQKHLIVCPD